MWHWYASIKSDRYDPSPVSLGNLLYAPCGLGHSAILHCVISDPTATMSDSDLRPQEGTMPREDGTSLHRDGGCSSSMNGVGAPPCAYTPLVLVGIGGVARRVVVWCVRAHRHGYRGCRNRQRGREHGRFPRLAHTQPTSCVLSAPRCFPSRKAGLQASWAEKVAFAGGWSRCPRSPWSEAHGLSPVIGRASLLGVEALIRRASVIRSTSCRECGQPRRGGGATIWL